MSEKTEITGVRILMVGTSGSGKTTVGRRAAAILGVGFTELDSIRHQANWTEMPDEDFRREVAAVAAVAAGDSWVIDGGYGIVRDITMTRATRIVWLDPPKHRVMRQVLWRSLSRAISRKPMWNGNRERFSMWLRPDHPIRWAWKTHTDRRSRFAQMMTGNWIRLQTRKQVRAWLDNLETEHSLNVFENMT